MALVGAVIAVLVPASHAKKVKSALPYEASVLVGAPPNGGGSPLRGGVTSPQILFYANQVSTKQAAISDAGVNVPVSEAAIYMTASVIPAAGAVPAGATSAVRRNTTTNVQLIGYGSTPEDALAIATAYAQDTSDAVDTGLESGAKVAGAASGFTVLAPATGASKIAQGKTGLSSSRKVRGLGGLAVGALLGAGIVLLRELLDKRLRNSTRAEANFGFPVIAEIPLLLAAGSGASAQAMPVVDVVRDPESPGAESYRMLRMSIMLESLAPLTGRLDPFGLGLDSGMGEAPPVAVPVRASTEGPGPRQVVMVASAGPEPSRPHVAANLAAIYAEAGQRVVVISTSFLTPGLNLAEPLQFAVDILPDDVEAKLEPSRLEHVFRLNLVHFVATSGQLVTRAPLVFEAARSLFDVVIVEVPPLLAVHHAEALAHAVDVVLVVAECGFTTFDDARMAGDHLRRMEAPVMGVVLTNVRIPHSDIRHLGLPRSTASERAEPKEKGELQVVGAGSGTAADPAEPSPG